jgi:beta-galactosidase
MKKNMHQPSGLTRRDFMQSCALGAVALASDSVLGSRIFAATGSGSANIPNGPASRRVLFNKDWVFVGKTSTGATAASFNDAKFNRVTLPHSAVKLSWQNWDYHKWHHLWTYRKHFTLPKEMRGMRVFLYFEGVMAGVAPTINDRKLPAHTGGYLPVRYEITSHLKDGKNVIALEVDGRWLNTPPSGSPEGPRNIDFLEPAGIHRSVWLEAVPAAYINNVFAKPADVLQQSRRRVEVSCTLDSTGVTGDAQVVAELRDGTRVLAQAKKQVSIGKKGGTKCALVLPSPGDIGLWSPDSPQLYDVVTTLHVGGQPVHDYKTRIGFREAKFTVDGFFLNGKRLQIFGLNRHELYPYVGYAMPPRVMRRDAEILKHEFNCNFVRCSHYPQTEAFLDACDELGLLVWDEIPGWQYIGDDTWKNRLVRDVIDMIMRDRNHPSVVIWGTRANESKSDVELYRKTRAVAKRLDGSRPTSGTMTNGTRRTWKDNWEEDVFTYDDYHAEPDGTVGIFPPVEGHPYLIGEAVGQFNYKRRRDFDSKYRRAGDVALQQNQAIYHAQAHNKAGYDPNICGVIAWCAFDYASIINNYNMMKCPGVADCFRIPKPGASFYRAQGDPSARPVIIPGFYWDFNGSMPMGPGKQSAIFSNCERLEVFVDGKKHATLEPDTKNYPNLRHAPFFVDLEIDGAMRPGLKIDGYVGGKCVLSRQFSSNPARDRLSLAADDTEIAGDGTDATRIVFKVTDEFGSERAFASGDVTFEIKGAGVLVGDNPFSLADSGGVGGVWLKGKPGGTGAVTVTATHPRLGSQTVTVNLSTRYDAFGA